MLPFCKVSFLLVGGSVETAPRFRFALRSPRAASLVADTRDRALSLAHRGGFLSVGLLMCIRAKLDSILDLGGSRPNPLALTNHDTILEQQKRHMLLELHGRSIDFRKRLSVDVS